MPEGCQASLRLLARYAGLETADQCEPYGLMIVEIVVLRLRGNDLFSHADGYEEAGAVSADCSLKIGWRYADDSEGMPVDKNRLADYIRRFRKTRLPVAVAENRNRVRIFCSVVLRAEEAAESGAKAEHLK